MARNVYLVQVNNKFGENKVFFPYSVGLLQAYAKTQSDLKESYRFARPLFLREDPHQIAKSLDNPDVLGVSSYIWNWEWNKALARETKEQHPDSLVVMGGPLTWISLFMEKERLFFLKSCENALNQIQITKG